MPDRVGQAFALTVLSPITTGHSHGELHATRIRTAITALERGAASPLARIDTLHLARLVVLDDLPQQGVPTQEDHLQSKYLLFVADFDGDLAGFLETLRTKATECVEAIWQHCEAFPGTADATAFHDYFARCHVPTTFGFSAYATTPLSRVLRALDTQRRLIRFLKANQGAEPVALQAAFQTFTRELAAAPLPAPGSI